MSPTLSPANDRNKTSNKSPTNLRIHGPRDKATHSCLDGPQITAPCAHNRLWLNRFPPRSIIRDLGSGLTNQSQKMTVAAMH
ncbi:MAG TPA: hypothetical protein PLK13_18630, partial [Xanthobacteraceae bacterium]|nr:hypothetical protein [Xanthobacteraceae bacterium]HQS49851.1 hypothetical protein [Xanthobacteraceae bacterium]